MLPNPFLLNLYTAFKGDKRCPIIGSTFISFEKLPIRNKQSPTGRKFAQSGHPDEEVHTHTDTPQQQHTEEGRKRTATTCLGIK
jgi:hypothetical protein